DEGTPPLAVHLADVELDRNRRAIAMPSDQFAPAADDRGHAGARRGAEVFVVCAAEGFVHQQLQVAAYDLVRRIAEQARRRGIAWFDDAVLVDTDDPVADVPEQRARTRVATPRPLNHAALFEGVADAALQRARVGLRLAEKGDRSGAHRRDV